MNLEAQTFTTRELLKILLGVGLRLEHERLKKWHQRDVLPGEPVGKGRERRYTLEELIYIASLTFVTKRETLAGEYIGDAGAVCLAGKFASAVSGVFKTGCDGNVVAAAPIWLLVENSAGDPEFEESRRDRTLSMLAEFYPTQAAVIAAPGYFAMQLQGAIEHLIEDRAQGQL
jgi:hypothetical protein